MSKELASISDALPKKRPVRQWALGLLVLSILVWLSTLYLQRLHPDWAWLGYVKAFAEAACIGGMADWFAVVALFRHPMGVPLPHTAILPAKQAQLARGVADFIGTHFLEPRMIAEQALKLQVGQRVADYTQKNLTVDAIAERLPGALSAIVAKLPETAPEAWLQAGQKSLKEYATGERLGRGAAKIVGWAQSERADQWLINRFAQATLQFCTAEDAVERIRPWLKQMAKQAAAENATWWDKFKTQVTGQAMDLVDDWLIEKILNAGATLAQKVLDEPDHPIHLWFASQCLNWQYQLNENPKAHDWLQRHAQNGLDNAMFTEWLGRMWTRVHAWLTDMSAGRTPQVEYLAQMLYDAISHQLAQPERQTQLSEAAANISARVLDSQQDNIRNWMTAQLNAWSKERLNEALENAIGNDLQYIRINGTLIGGLIGLILYVVSGWLG